MTVTNPEIDLEAAAEKINQLFKGPMEFYEKPPLEDELNLIKEVRDRFVKYGQLEKMPDCYDNNRFIVEAIGKNSHVQQFHLNRYLSIQLMASGKDTAVERYALMNEVNPSQWLTVFEERILPACINLDLPIKI